MTEQLSPQMRETKMKKKELIEIGRAIFPDAEFELLVTYAEAVLNYSLTVEDECRDPYIEGELEECVCSKCKKKRNQIALRKWEGYNEYLGMCVEKGIPLSKTLSFPDWLNKENTK